MQRVRRLPFVICLTALVGKLSKNAGDLADLSDRGDLNNMRGCLLTALILQDSQRLIEVLELDLNNEIITSRKIDILLRKMRLLYRRRARSVKEG